MAKNKAVAPTTQAQSPGNTIKMTQPQFTIIHSQKAIKGQYE
jgi:hypothetical protein